MRGTYLPLIPCPPPRPNLDRPVWGPYNALRPYRSRGKEAAAAASFPLGEGLGWTNVQPRLRLVWACINLYPDFHSTRGRGRTLGQGHCHWYVCWPGQVFGHPWTRPGHTTTTCIHMSPLFNYYHYAWYSVLRICESPKSVRSIYAMHTNLPGFTLACHEGYSDASLLRVISLRR